MIWSEIPNQNVIEPIEIESVRDYLGYSPRRHEEDDLLYSMIRSARSRLEEYLGRAIVRRKFIKHVSEAGEHNLLPHLIGVDSISCVDNDGAPHNIQDYLVKKGENATVSFEAGDPNIDLNSGFEIIFESGFSTCPESIKTAILKICKIDMDRKMEDAMEMVSGDVKAFKVDAV